MLTPEDKNDSRDDRRQHEHSEVTGLRVPSSSGAGSSSGSRLIEHKNVDRLLDAFDAVADDHDATLGIVGDGPERDRLEAKHDTLSSVDRVEFLGFLDDYEDVLGHMRAAAIFVSPSTREGFGLTFAEAMAVDCTVIAADHPESAADEVIGDAGFLVEPTIASLTQMLDATLDGSRPPTSPVARAKKHDWDRVAVQAESVYQQTIDHPR
jgi:glycosyltransferase involved in cell wall biosynthesis